MCYVICIDIIVPVTCSRARVRPVDAIDVTSTYDDSDDDG